MKTSLTMGLIAMTVASCTSVLGEKAKSDALPNIVVIYADDLGYGDVSCLNPESKIKTPYIDRLASQGIIFTDGHAPDAICSPSRYGLLTGRYSWRSHIKSGNPKPGEQPWIPKTRLTLASMLKAKGYDTAAIGKWGVSSDWAAAAKPNRKALAQDVNSIDYSKPVHSGQCIGFTYDWVHLWYGDKYYSTTKYAWDQGAYRDGGRWFFENGMADGGKPDFPAFDMRKAQMDIVERCVKYIDAKGGRVDYPKFNQDKSKPFFLYYAAHIPHGPIVPAEQFQGTSGCGDYGDFVHEFDWAVGQITEALKRNKMLDNTIIVVTSDNGPEAWCYSFVDKFKHQSMGALRGVKRDVWEGGHRVPFIVSWPEKIKQGVVSDRMVNQIDLTATIADVVGYEVAPKDAEDSFSFAKELHAEISETTPVRDTMIHHSSDNKYAFRSGDWLYVDYQKGGSREPEWFRKRLGAEKHKFPGELFNLKDDPSQKVNLYETRPEKVKQMREALKAAQKAGRTVPQS